MRGEIIAGTAVTDRRTSRFRAVARAGARAAAATVAATALATGAFVLPADAEPITTETKLAEHTNPAVQVITTEYQASVKLGRIEFSKAGQQLILRSYVKYLHGDFGAAGFVNYIFDRAQRDPAHYFKEAGSKRTQKLSAQFVGSGFIASPDGYVVTARHVVTPDSDVKKMFAQAGAANFAKADATALLKDFAKFDLSTGRDEEHRSHGQRLRAGQGARRSRQAEGRGAARSRVGHRAAGRSEPAGRGRLPFRSGAGRGCRGPADPGRRPAADGAARIGLPTAG